MSRTEKSPPEPDTVDPAQAPRHTEPKPGGVSSVSWPTAASATLHCLTGCAIGEVLGMVIGTTLGLHNVTTVILSVALAFVFGYALTMRGVLSAGIGFTSALKVALAADTVSILIMEILDNAIMVAVPGAMDAGITSPLFWGALAFSLLVAFLVTTPANRWLISRGKGHAVVHAYHHH
ncbi:MAG: Conserved putative rane protein [Pseudonocardia sp.]|nr:Conserved putative rane protein [Pseudonocardia sp.]